MALFRKVSSMIKFPAIPHMALLGILLFLAACNGAKEQAGPVVTQPSATTSAPAQEHAESDVLVSRTVTITMPGMKFRKLYEHSRYYGWIESFDHRNGYVTVISVADPYEFKQSGISTEYAEKTLRDLNVLKAWKYYDPVSQIRTGRGELFIWAEKEHNCVIYSQYLFNPSGILSDGFRPENTTANILLTGKHCGPGREEIIRSLTVMLNSITMN